MYFSCKLKVANFSFSRLPSHLSDFLFSPKYTFIIKMKIAASPQQICSQRETVLGAAGFGIPCQRDKSAVNRYCCFVSCVGVGFFCFSALKYCCCSHRAVFLSLELPREFLPPISHIFQHLSANLSLPVFGLFCGPCFTVLSQKQHLA